MNQVVKRSRLLENECLYLRKAVKEYKCNRFNNDKICNHLNKKLKAIINKYEYNKPIINKISCQEIENEIVKCYVELKTINFGNSFDLKVCQALPPSLIPGV